MQKDKQLEDMLRKWGVEETSADFTSNVMNKIEASYAINQYKQPFMHNKIKHIFIAAFLLIAIVVFILSVFINPADIPFRLSINLPVVNREYFINIISFLIAFWIVLVGNYLMNNKFKPGINN